MTSRKYHVDPKTGNMGVCRARKGNCPFGGEDGTANHYDSEAEAQAVSEFIHAQNAKRSSMRRRKAEAKAKEQEAVEAARIEAEKQEAKRKAQFDKDKVLVLGDAFVLREELDPSSDFMKALDDKAEKAIAIELDRQQEIKTKAVNDINANHKAMRDLATTIIGEMESFDENAADHKDVYDTMRTHPEMFVTMVSIGGDERFKDLRNSRQESLSQAEEAVKRINNLNPEEYRTWRRGQVNHSMNEIAKVEDLVKTMESMEPVQDMTGMKKILCDRLSYDRIPRDHGPREEVWRRRQTPDFPAYINHNDNGMMDADNLRYLDFEHGSMERIEPVMQSQDGERLLVKVDGFQFSNSEWDPGSGAISMGYETLDLKTGESSNRVDVFKQSVKGVSSERFDLMVNENKVKDLEKVVPRFNDIKVNDPLENLREAVDRQRDSIVWVHGDEAMKIWSDVNGRRTRIEQDKRAWRPDLDEELDDLIRNPLDQEISKMKEYESEVYEEGYNDAY